MPHMTRRRVPHIIVADMKPEYQKMVSARMGYSSGLVVEEFEIRRQAKRRRGVSISKGRHLQVPPEALERVGYVDTFEPSAVDLAPIDL